MSNSQGILVVAKTLTLSLILLIWSIYLRNSVFMRRSVSLSFPVRRLPRLSISSIRMIEGACSIANSKIIISRCSLSPMYFEVMSLTLTQKHVALEWWQTAWVSMVLPTPGGPKSRIDCHGLTLPISNSWGHYWGTTKDMLMQSFAYSHPAMSSKEMSGLLVRMHFRSAFFSSMLYLVLSSECMFSPIWQLDCESQTIWVELRTFLEISRVALHSSGVIDCDSIPES